MGTPLSVQKKPFKIQQPQKIKIDESRYEKFGGTIYEVLSKIKIGQQTLEQEYEIHKLPVKDMNGQQIFIHYNDQNNPVSYLIQKYLTITQQKIPEDLKKYICFLNTKDNQLIQRVNKQPKKIKDVAPLFKQNLMKVVTGGSGQQDKPITRAFLTYDPKNYVRQGKPISITVQYQGKKKQMKCFSKDPIGKVNYDLQKLFDVSQNFQAIYLKKNGKDANYNRQLQQGNSLQDQNVDDKDYLILIKRQVPKQNFKGAQVIIILIKYPLVQKQYQVSIERSRGYKIFDVKKAVSQEINRVGIQDQKINPQQFRLTLCGKVLNDQKQVQDYRIHRRTRLHLIPNTFQNRSRDMLLLKLNFNQRSPLQFIYGDLKHKTVKTIIQENINKENAYGFIFNDQILNPESKLAVIEERIPKDCTQIILFLFRSQKHQFYEKIDSIRNSSNQNKEFNSEIYQSCRQKITQWQSKIQENHELYSQKYLQRLRNPIYSWPIFDYTNQSYRQINSHLRQICMKLDPQNLSTNTSFIKVSSLIQAVKPQQNFIGNVFRAVRDYKFSKWHTVGNLVCYYSFTSASKLQQVAKNFLNDPITENDPLNIPKNESNISKKDQPKISQCILCIPCMYKTNSPGMQQQNVSDQKKQIKYKTLFKIKSLTGRSIQDFSYYKDQQQVIFLPFTYFIVENIENYEYAYPNTELVTLVEVPSPQFKKDTLLWVDDKPEERRQILNQISNVNFEVLTLTSTKIAQTWMRQFKWLYHLANRRLKIVSTLKRKQIKYRQSCLQYLTENQHAGIDLLRIFFEFYPHYNYRFLIFAEDRRQAIQQIRQNIDTQRDRQIHVSDIQHKQVLLNFCNFNPMTESSERMIEPSID